MPVLLLDHSTALSIGGILRYRIRIDPNQGVSRVKALQFRVRNTSPVYRNLTPASGPWKISIALVREPAASAETNETATTDEQQQQQQQQQQHNVWRKGIVPELSPSVGCGQMCRFTETVDKNNKDHNEWELEVLSEMITQKNWLTVRVEVLAELEDKNEEAALERQQQQQPSPKPPLHDNKDSDALDAEDKEAADIEDVPQVLHPDLISCQYKDTAAICGAKLPRGWRDHFAVPKPSTAASDNQEEKNNDTEHDDGLHLVVLSHGIHGSWLDMLYIKEQIDAYTDHRYGSNNRTVTFLSNTNHAGTEEGLQMAGRRLARDILEITGYWPRHTEQSEGMTSKKSSSSGLGRSKTLGSARNKEHHRQRLHSHKHMVSLGRSTLSSSLKTRKHANDHNNDNDSNERPQALKRATTIRSALNDVPFPRGFRRISIIGHSLGGLINMYALGVNLDHPWVLGYVLSKGLIGQTGKDLAMEDRSTLATNSSSTSEANGSTTVTKGESSGEQATHSRGDMDGTPLEADKEPDCELDDGPDPLLLAMARPGSVSHRALKRFRRRICYGNIDNDLPVQYNTCTLMGIPNFDRDHFFSSDGPASGQKKNLYNVAIQSYISILFPRSPPRRKFMEPYEDPSPIVAVHQSDPLPSSPSSSPQATQRKNGQASVQSSAPQTVDDPKSAATSRSSSMGRQNSSGSGSASSSASLSAWSARALSLRRKRKHGQEAHEEAVVSRTTEELAQLVADGYHTGMDWTKIGVYFQSDAHVQIIVRRKWYNVDGWPCVRDFVERHDFS
ncbi:hypothetical protein BGW41_007471 [Actinomortierella wolfii]|nr:hypothetical protein BGW41_007471 [Actinomortierella wolfii]